jgi:hypothetical protein
MVNKLINQSNNRRKQVMKRLFTLLALALVINSAIAQQVNSILNLRLSDNSVFTIWVNGTQAGTQGNVARVEGLAPGQQYVQIYRLNDMWGYNNYDNVFSGFVSMPASSELFATVNLVSHAVQYDQVVALAPVYHNTGIRGSRYGNELTTKQRMREHNWNNNCNQQPVVCEPTPVVCGPQVMDNYSFQQLKMTIANASFESTKLTIFKQALAYNFFTTAQVRELMCQFTFDSYRLDVAKLAYPKTVDPNNYFLVNNAFTFSSNVYDLNQYIASL